MPSLPSLELPFLHFGVHPFALYVPALISLFLAKVQLSLTLTLSHHTIWYSGLTALFLFAFGKDGSGVLANCSLCGTEATLSFSASRVCSSFSAEAWAILQALSCSWQHQQVCHFSSIPISLAFREGRYHSILSYIFPFTSISLADLAGTV